MLNQTILWSSNTVHFLSSFGRNVLQIAQHPFNYSPPLEIIILREKCCNNILSHTVDSLKVDLQLWCSAKCQTPIFGNSKHKTIQKTKFLSISNWPPRPPRPSTNLRYFGTLFESYSKCHIIIVQIGIFHQFLSNGNWPVW